MQLRGQKGRKPAGGGVEGKKKKRRRGSAPTGETRGESSLPRKNRGKPGKRTSVGVAGRGKREKKTRGGETRAARS